jgi:hypothetical protein
MPYMIRIADGKNEVEGMQVYKLVELVDDRNMPEKMTLKELYENHAPRSQADQVVFDLTEEAIEDEILFDDSEDCVPLGPHDYI